MRSGIACLGLVACSSGIAWSAPDWFEAPVRLQAGGAFIDTEIGHAAPWVGDFDGDGIRDLLVGQFGGGKLLIFHNEGTTAAPRFGPGRLFQDGKPEGTVPAG